MKPHPPKPSTGPPTCETSYGRIWIPFFFFFLSGFGRAMDFMISIGYPSDPPDHYTYPLDISPHPVTHPPTHPYFPHFSLLILCLFFSLISYIFFFSLFTLTLSLLSTQSRLSLLHGLDLIEYSQSWTHRAPQL